MGSEPIIEPRSSPINCSGSAQLVYPVPTVKLAVAVTTGYCCDCCRFQTGRWPTRTRDHQLIYHCKLPGIYHVTSAEQQQ